MQPTYTSGNVLFVLGGNDAEMEVIKNLLSAAGISYLQPVRGWGEKTFSPQDLGLEVENFQVGPSGYETTHTRIYGWDFVVFVECGAKDWPEGPEPVLVDHHFGRSGEPASLTQVLSILRRLPGMVRKYHNTGGSVVSQVWAEARAAEIEAAVNFSSATRRWLELVAANDARYIPGMLAFGATQEEIDRVRAFDRSAQGINQAQEAEGLRAVGEKQVEGRLTVVRMAHSKTATVADRIFGQYDQLLILSGDGEANFFGDGALCAVLKEKFEGWNGGSGLGKAGETAYWGGYPNQDELLAFVREQVK